MNEYVAKITLDLNCQATPVVISAGQYDIGRKILITLTADGEAYDANGAKAVCKGKNNNNYFAVNTTVAKNIVTVTTDKAMLSSAGRTVAKIVLTDGTRTYSTQPFIINTHSDYDGDITTSDYYPELLDILSRVIALTESGAVLTDTALDAKSVNPVQNKVLTAIINNKANKATTLAGYGITDAYTRERTNEKLAQKLNSMPFDSEPKNNSPCYLTSGAVYNALLVKTDKTALATKYDSSNIESGTSTLTPYSTVTDKIKSANCTYKTIGDIVIVSATVKMNAVSLGGNSMCPLIDLPYKCISEDNVFCVGISNLGKLFKFAIPKNNTWLQFSTQDKTAYTFADGEQINVICLYKIK